MFSLSSYFLCRALMRRASDITYFEAGFLPYALRDIFMPRFDDDMIFSPCDRQRGYFSFIFSLYYYFLARAPLSYFIALRLSSPRHVCALRGIIDIFIFAECERAIFAALASHFRCGFVSRRHFSSSISFADISLQRDFLFLRELMFFFSRLALFFLSRALLIFCAASIFSC